MRRIAGAFGVCLWIQLAAPPPAQAWWGWWDELSGPKLSGPEIEVRVFCFVDAKKPDDTVAVQSAGRQVALAYDLFDDVLIAAPVSGLDAAEKSVATQRMLLVNRFAELTAAALALTVNDAAKAQDLSIRATTVADQVGQACPPDMKGCAAQQNALTLVRSILNAAAATYNVVKAEAEEQKQLTPQASAGVAFSACPFQRDLFRRGSIDLTFRALRSRGDSRTDYAGGNELRMVTFTPGVSWRPFIGVADGRADWIDLGAGAGIYWFSSKGDNPGSFEPFRGVILEPLRIDLHVPSSIARKRGVFHKLLGVTSVRFGLAVFPAGFRAGAFGDTTKSAQANQIRAEWVKHYGIFVDVFRLLHPRIDP